MNLCEYSENKSYGINVCIKCKLTKDYCGMYRFCTITQEPVMNDTYLKHGCKIKKDFGVDKMPRKKKEPLQTIESVDGLNKVICKVNYTKNGETSIQLIEGKSNIFIDGTFVDRVEVTYTDELCKKNIVSVKQI